MDMKNRRHRVLSGLVGAALVVAAVSGLSWAWQSPPAYAQPTETAGHDTMDKMMDAMHGRASGAAMHDVEGAEEMMDAGAPMMEMMGGMSETNSMMRGGGADMGLMMRDGASDMGAMMRSE